MATSSGMGTVGIDGIRVIDILEDLEARGLSGMWFSD